MWGPLRTRPSRVPQPSTCPESRADAGGYGKGCAQTTRSHPGSLRWAPRTQVGSPTTRGAADTWIPPTAGFWGAPGGLSPCACWTAAQPLLRHGASSPRDPHVHLNPSLVALLAGPVKGGALCYLHKWEREALRATLGNCCYWVRGGQSADSTCHLGDTMSSKRSSPKPVTHPGAPCPLPSGDPAVQIQNAAMR